MRRLSAFVWHAPPFDSPGSPSGLRAGDVVWDELTAGVTRREAGRGEGTSLLRDRERSHGETKRWRQQKVHSYTLHVS